MMKNRIPKAAGKLIGEKVLARNDRGSSVMTVCNDNKISVINWFDNKAITLSSASHAISPQDNCRHWSKNEKRYLTLNHPSIITQ